MHRVNFPACLILGLSLLSCSAIRPGPSETANLPARLFQSGYSVVPPREKGWSILDRDNYRLILVKRGPSQNESYAAVAGLILLPSNLNNRDLYFEHIRLARSREFESNGIRILSNQESMFDEKGDFCVRYRSETVAAGGSGVSDRPGSLVVEAIGFYCRHPAEPTVAVKAEYSYRHRPGNDDRELEEKAERFLKAVNFESLTAE
jgi:hypothetical protein